jgi:hypothetical protein
LEPDAPLAVVLEAAAAGNSALEFDAPVPPVAVAAAVLFDGAEAALDAAATVCASSCRARVG